MGTFRVSVTAVGNHGCQRQMNGAEIITGCGQSGCTDCITREYVEKLKKAASVSEAYILHWPGSQVRPDGLGGEVLDNLLTERRLGRFN